MFAVMFFIKSECSVAQALLFYYFIFYFDIFHILGF